MPLDLGYRPKQIPQTSGEIGPGEGKGRPNYLFLPKETAKLPFSQKLKNGNSHSRRCPLADWSIHTWDWFTIGDGIQEHPEALTTCIDLPGCRDPTTILTGYWRVFPPCSFLPFWTFLSPPPCFFLPASLVRPCEKKKRQTSFLRKN